MSCTLRFCPLVFPPPSTRNFRCSATNVLDYCTAKGQWLCMQNTLAPLIGWKPWAALLVNAQKVPGAYLGLFRAPHGALRRKAERVTSDTPVLCKPILAVGQVMLFAVAVFLAFMAHRPCKEISVFALELSRPYGQGERGVGGKSCFPALHINDVRCSERWNYFFLFL